MNRKEDREAFRKTAKTKQGLEEFLKNSLPDSRTDMEIVKGLREALVKEQSRKNPQMELRPIGVTREGRVKFYEPVSDLYSTPQPVFDYFNELYNFTLDGAANEGNAKCSRFNSLEAPNRFSWEGERVWCNPPYSKKQEFIARLDQGPEVAVLLMPNSTEARWFFDLYQKCFRVHPIVGRISFEHQTQTGRILKKQPMNGSSIFIYTGDSRPAGEKMWLVLREHIWKQQ